MIVRSPETWETMSGEGMDDDGSKGIGMSGLQPQQVKAAESPRPGSSGSNSSSSSSSGWGTCSELLLVSAVKKHGVPNWNSVALELRARAILLDIPPSCFTEEACKFKYNVLKGKFSSSSSSGGGSVSSPDDDLNGMSWFEELRKLRMSHLKEELQVYDSSIGQLQSRITRLQEERARYLSPQSVMKEEYDSSCGIDTQLPTKDSKSSDMEAPVPRPSSEVVLEISQDSAPTNVAQSVVPSESIVIGDVNGQYPSEMALEPENRKDWPGTFGPQPIGQGFTDGVKGGADLASGLSIPPEPHMTESEKVAVKGEDQVSSITPNEALQVREDEIGKEELDLDIETLSSTSDQRIVAEPSEAQGGDDDDVTVRGEDIFYPASADDLAMPEKEISVGLGERAQGNVPELDKTVSTLCPPRVSPSTSTVADNPEDLSAWDPLDTLGVTSESSPSRAPEAEETSNTRGTSQGDSFSKRESRHSKLGLSYGRAGKGKRSKAREESKQKRLFAPDVREVEDDQPSQSLLQEGDVFGVEEKVIKDTSIPLDQSDIGGISHSDPSPVDEVEARSISQDAEHDSPTPGSGDGANFRLECSRLDNESMLINAEHLPSGMDVVQARTDLLSNKGAETASPEDDMPLLTVSLGPDPELIELRSSVFTPTSENIPTTENENEVSNGGDLQDEVAIQRDMPNEVKSSSSSMIPAETDGKREEIPQEVNDVIMESENVEVVQGQEVKIDEVVDNVPEGEEGETPETDLGIARSVGDDVPETLDTKDSENGQEESRDSPEIGEVQQSFPDYTDSQIDKSEVGSSMDSIEDMSPSNRKNRREPKVPGKYLPLLECLRVICAHKFAPLFRQRQEYQENSKYIGLVRRHVDLSMVRTRLEDGAYSGSVEFFRDLLLIFTNALVYNSSDSQEYVSAKALRSCALTEMEKILQTEALLKQNGPATRKREVRKSMDVHKVRAPSTSAGSEVRKKGILKGSNETPAALDNNSSQGGAKSAHIAFDDTHAGRFSNISEADRELDVKIETTFKKAAANRIVKEETPRKELQKPEFRIESGSRSAGGTSGKKVKVERDAQKTSLQGQLLADLRASVGRQNVESTGNKTTSAKMKDMLCIDLEKKGTPYNSSSLVSSGLPVEKQRTTPILRQTSTSRVSRYSKRGGDSTSSNPKKRVRK